MTTTEDPYRPDYIIQLPSVSFSSESSLSLEHHPSLNNYCPTESNYPVLDKKALPPTRASSDVSAFVTFLKALFGVSLLSSPRAFDETGLLLGTLTFSVIIVACAFACYLLVQARAVVVERSQMEGPTNHAQFITYGVLARKLLGGRAAVVITFLIVILHLLFGAGMLSGSIHEISAATGLEQGQDWWSRILLSLCLLPIVSLLLQFRHLTDLFRICAAGLVVYMVGCVGTMVYVTILKSINSNDEEGVGPPDAPTDWFEWKFEGIPRFVGSTICAIEGINLALPTANSLGGRTGSAAPLVCSVVFIYGFLTLGVAWIGYLGGLGGGAGTMHGEDSCQDISYCLDSALISRIHQISLGAALLLTLPIILFPSIQMLEIWSDERRIQLETGRTTSNRTIQDGWNGYVIGSEALRVKEIESSTPLNHNAAENEERPFIQRHWKLRLVHAILVCSLGAAERAFKPLFTFLTGVGLSFAGFLLPCLFYVYAKENISKPMRLAMAGLCVLGLCNIVLVFISVFTSHDLVSKRREHHNNEEEQ